MITLTDCKTIAKKLGLTIKVISKKEQKYEIYKKGEFSASAYTLDMLMKKLNNCVKINDMREKRRNEMHKDWADANNGRK